MGDRDQDLELIERYLKGDLSRTELSDFQDRLDSDHEFARKLRLRQSFPSLFHAAGADLISTMDAPSMESVPQKKTRSPVKRHVIAGAILLVAAVIAGLLIYMSPKAPEKPEEKMAIADSVPEKTQPAAEVPAARVVQPVDTPEQEETASGPVAPDVPADSIVLPRDEEILFRWTMETDSFTNFYIHAIPSGKLMWWRGIRPGVRELTLPAGKLWKGTYFWYVGDRKYGRTLIIRD